MHWPCLLIFGVILKSPGRSRGLLPTAAKTGRSLLHFDSFYLQCPESSARMTTVAVSFQALIVRDFFSSGLQRQGCQSKASQTLRRCYHPLSILVSSRCHFHLHYASELRFFKPSKTSFKISLLYC